MGGFYGDSLGSVHSGATAETDHHFRLMGKSRPGAFRNVVCGGIGLDPVKMSDIKTRLTEDLLHPLEHGLQFRNRGCRHQQASFSESLTEGGDVIDLSTAEEDFSRLIIAKGIHMISPHFSHAFLIPVWRDLKKDQIL